LVLPIAEIKKQNGGVASINMMLLQSYIKFKVPRLFGADI
jgi:hypothetical protein